MQLSEFVWILCSSVWFVFNNFLLIDATDRSKINSNHHRIFFCVSLYPLSFFSNTPFRWDGRCSKKNYRFSSLFEQIFRSLKINDSFCHSCFEKFVCSVNGRLFFKVLWTNDQIKIIRVFFVCFENLFKYLWTIHFVCSMFVNFSFQKNVDRLQIWCPSLPLIGSTISR